MEQPLENYLVDIAAKGDPTRIGEIDAQIDSHLGGFKDATHGVTIELIRLKREFAAHAPET